MKINNYNVPINITICIEATSYDDAEDTALDWLDAIITDDECISSITVDTENITKSLI